jgi:hypothetical protein
MGSYALVAELDFHKLKDITILHKHQKNHDKEFFSYYIVATNIIVWSEYRKTLPQISLEISHAKILLQIHGNISASVVVH